jgi:hypothetical protein
MTTKPITIITPPPEPTRVPDAFTEARKLAGKIRKIDEKVKRQIAAADGAKDALLMSASPAVRAMVEIAMREQASEAVADELIDLDEEAAP